MQRGALPGRHVQPEGLQAGQPDLIQGPCPAQSACSMKSAGPGGSGPAQQQQSSASVCNRLPAGRRVPESVACREQKGAAWTM